ncbi:MAG: hypothetical protein AMS21_07095 [Gemmatimonas sp. SG8_38_2]|nr:MAG: hypothetical protein AMS21_07095 [Gemmatimonas sp. SG8_38_2]
MYKRIFNMLLAALLVGVVAACDEDSSILDPENNPQSIELELMVDEDLTEALVMDAEAAIDATLGPAPMVSGMEFSEPPVMFSTPPDPEIIAEARAKLRDECRPLFQQAREAWRSGDTEAAAEFAFQGRLCVAEALIMVFGEEAYDNLWERLEHVLTWLEEGVDEDTSDLIARIRELMDEADEIKNGPEIENQLALATERLLLALQIGNRERFRQRRQEMQQHARFSIFMAQSAINLALQVAGDDITERQVRAARHAQHMIVHAVQAQENGRYGLAFHLAREAVNVGLLVVVLEPGVTEANLVEVMVQLSAMAIQAAQQALSGAAQQEFAEHLLRHAEMLKGKADLVAATRPRVAVHLYWHAAVTAYGVILLSSDSA